MKKRYWKRQAELTRRDWEAADREWRRQVDAADAHRYLAKVLIQAVYVWRAERSGMLISDLSVGECCLMRALDAYENKQLLLNPQPDAVVVWREEADKMEKRSNEYRRRLFELNVECCNLRGELYKLKNPTPAA